MSCARSTPTAQTRQFYTKLHVCMQVMHVMQARVPFAQSNQIGLATWRHMGLAYAGNRECLHGQMPLQFSKHHVTCIVRLSLESSQWRLIYCQRMVEDAADNIYKDEPPPPSLSASKQHTETSEHYNSHFFLLTSLTS